MNAVIDTNILGVANFQAEHATLQCIENSINFLLKIKDGGGCVSVDSGQEIFDEYQKYASHSGQPGVGDVFFKWLYLNQGHPEICEFVGISWHPERVFVEFPDEPALEKFDRSDRKFVAVAIASLQKPKIYNASDADWHEFEAAFTRLGVPVIELCSG